MRAVKCLWLLVFFFAVKHFHCYEKFKAVQTFRSILFLTPSSLVQLSEQKKNINVLHVFVQTCNIGRVFFPVAAFKMCDLGVEVKQKISNMLDNASYGVGGSKQLAAVYQMNKADIRGLSKQAKPAEQVLEFIGSKFPALTVYEFCMKLHYNKSLQRNDVVQVLSDYLDQKKPQNARGDKTYCVYYF